MTVTLSTGDVQRLLQQGFAALQAQRIDEASDCCRRVLGVRPDLVEGHFLVGLVALELNDRKTALSAFGSVTKLNPSHAAAWAQLARLFASLGQANRADRALQEAVVHENGEAVVQDLIGTGFSLLGDHLQSHAWFARAVQAQPDNVAFVVNRANARVYLGRIEDAESDLAHSLKLAPDNPQAHWMLSGARKAHDTGHIDELEQLLARRPRHPRAEAFLHYARGKELEDLQQWERAWDAFEKGAAARRRTVDFNEASESSMFDAFEKLFTREWLAAHNDGCENPAPIFVVGQPRTGTTLVERIITSHSQVHSAGELQHFGMSVRRLSNYSAPHRFTADLPRLAASLDARKLGETYLNVSRGQAGALPRFVDKLPVNYLFIPLILKALPNARIVHLTRDPMDACFASFKQLFADAYPHSYDQGEMARHHARYLSLMAVWRQRFPGRFLDIAYEDVASDVEPNARRLIDYLDLPWEDHCLNFHQLESAVSTASAVQVREPAHTRSIGRWRHYEHRLAPMRRALQEAGIEINT